MQFYVNLKNNIEDMDQVKISSNYSLGGMNYFTGQPTKRGYYIYFIPVKVRKTDYGQCEQTVLFHKKSYKMCVCVVDRKSKKMQEKVDNILKANYLKMAELYEEDDNKLYAFVQELYMDL